MSSLLGLAETIKRHGLFGSLYTDRGGHYFITPKDSSKVDKTHSELLSKIEPKYSQNPSCGEIGLP